MAINIDKEVLDSLQSSTCYGIAYDETVPECKKCDVSHQCKARCAGADVVLPTKREKTAPAPSTTTTTKSSSSTKKSTSSTATSNKKSTSSGKASTHTTTAPTGSDTPDFKGMNLAQLQELATKLGVEWTDYGNDNITRMRLVMTLKKQYK